MKLWEYTYHSPWMFLLLAIIPVLVYLRLWVKPKKEATISHSDLGSFAATSSELWQVLEKSIIGNIHSDSGAYAWEQFDLHESSKSFPENISFLKSPASSFKVVTFVPNQSEMDWLSNLSTAMDLPIQHLSCYALTVEEDTILFHDIRKGKTAAPIDENASTHFDILMAFAAENGIEHYEISNFCKPGFESKHNTSYWQNKAYIGLGPSAHSFNKISRQWNIANNKKYIDALNENKLLFEEETLTKTERLNEYIMTGLRTKWGIDLSYIDEVFDKKKELMNKIGNEDQSLFEWEIKRSKKGTAFIYKLSNKGMHFADRIASNLFFD